MESVAGGGVDGARVAGVGVVVMAGRKELRRYAVPEEAELTTVTIRIGEGTSERPAEPTSVLKAGRISELMTCGAARAAWVT
jgi:hypothetical protein